MGRRRRVSPGRKLNEHLTLHTSKKRFSATVIFIPLASGPARSGFALSGRDGGRRGAMGGRLSADLPPEALDPPAPRGPSGSSDPMAPPGSLRRPRRSSRTGGSTRGRADLKTTVSQEGGEDLFPPRPFRGWRHFGGSARCGWWPKGAGDRAALGWGMLPEAAVGRSILRPEEELSSPSVKSL